MSDIGRVVTLKNRSHHDLLVAGLWNLLQKRRGVDFEIELCGRRSLHAHRIILEVFLLPDHLGAPRSAPEKITPDVEEHERKTPHPIAGDVQAVATNEQHRDHIDLNSLLLEFLYKGIVDVPREQLDDLLQLATELNFKLLVETIQHSKSDGGGRSRRQRSVKRSCHIESASDGQTDPSGGQVDGDDDETTVPPKRRKPRKADPVSTIDTVAVVEEARVVRRTMPRRLAKEHAETTAEDDNDDASTNEIPSGVSLSSRLFGCPQCPYMTRTRNRLKIHLARHDASSTFLSCTSCTKLFLCSASLERHRLHVHAADPSKKSCPHCDAQVSSRSGLIGHMKVVHGLNASGKPVKKRLACDFCRETFVYKSHLDLHVATRHTGERPFQCSECSYSAFRFMELRTHVKFKHATERPCVCEVCGFTTVTMSNMIKHRRVHTKEKPFVCQCGKAYRNKESLNQHAVRHQEGYSEEKARTHMCHICGKGFLSRKNLMGHLRKIHLLDTPPSTSPKTRDPPAPVEHPSQLQLN